MIARRYFSGELLRGWLLVAAILISLFALLSLIEESDNLSERYQFAHALAYVALTTPQRVLNLSPVIAALGTLIAFARMARGSEIVILRAAGFSRAGLLRLCAPAAVLLLCALAISEQYYVADMHQAGETRRQVLRSGNVDLLAGRGLWSNSGKRFFNVRNLRVGQIPEGISYYEFDDSGDLKVAIDAVRAQPMKDRNWKLIDVRYKEWRDGRVSTKTLTELELGPFWSAEELPVIGHSLDSMSPGALYQYATYLRTSGQPFDDVLMAFWQKIALPISAFTMVLLAAIIGTSLGSARSARFGAHLLAGAATGVGFYLLTQIINTGGRLLGLDASVIAFIPIALALLLCAVLAFALGRPR